MYDVVIIGAGVSGSACARELSRYNLSVCVVEKEEDVCCGTSKANSAIVHSGIDCKPGTLMAEMNIRGNELMEQLSKDLDFEFRRNGSLILCFAEGDRPKLEALYQQGVTNKIPDIRILDSKEVHEMEPNISDEVVAAIYCPTGGIVCPFGLNIALAENAATNGVEFRFHTEVTDITRKEDGYQLTTNQGYILTKCVVNAAGVYAGQIGKGNPGTPTVHGNTLIGPTADDHDDKEATNTTAIGLDHVCTAAKRSVPSVPVRQVITSFSGNRAHEDNHEFIIEELSDAPFFVDCAGIESPGLTSSPAIGERVAEIVSNLFHAAENPAFNGARKGILNPKELSEEDYAALIKEQPAYGNIICRCEMITEGEIIDAIRRPLGAKSLDGVKRRTRAGMGRCQAGFCSPRTMEILSRELGVSQLEITKSGGASNMVVGLSKDRI